MQKITNSIELHANEIISSAQAGMFYDLANFNIPYVKEKNDLYESFIQNYYNFFPLGTANDFFVTNPGIRDTDGNITPEKLPTVFSINAPNIENRCKVEKGEFFDAFLNQLDISKKVYDNLNNEPITNKLENKKNGLLNDFKYVIKTMEYLKQDSFDLFENHFNFNFFFVIVSSIIFCLDTLGISLVILSHIFDKFFLIYSFSIYYSIGFWIYIIAYLATIFWTIPLIMISVFYSDLCYFASIEGLGNSNNPLFNNTLTRLYNIYALVDKTNYFDQFQIQNDLFSDIFAL